MSTEGAMPQASACTAWARPISSPSSVMKELRAIFWDLKGAAEYPSSRKIRPRPAQSQLFPAFDIVPWIMIGLAAILYFPQKRNENRSRSSSPNAKKSAEHPAHSRQADRMSSAPMCRMGSPMKGFLCSSPKYQASPAS